MLPIARFSPPVLFAVVLLVLADFSLAASNAALPAWYQRELTQLAQEGGRWIADNRPFRTDAEPFDAYGIEWKASADQRGLTGRLFGLAEGEERAEFWQYRIYWDARREQAVVEQFASFGVTGRGTMLGFDQSTLLEQTFTAPDGRQWRELHHAWFENEVHVTRSFELQAGAWSPKRSYRWVRDR